MMKSSMETSPRNFPARQVERQLNVRLLPILALIFGGIYLLTSYKGWLIFFIGLGVAWLLAFTWVRMLERNLHIERRILHAWATAGESVPESVRLVNRGWLPALWVELNDDSPSLEKPLSLVSDIGSHASRSRNISHLFKRRGIYSLGPTLLRCGDPLGIYTLTMHDPHASTILVTPPLLSTAQLRMLTGGWAGDENRTRGSVARSISDAGVRAYAPGDSLRRIHWRASAHAGSLVVRQMEAARSRDWWIYLDLHGESQAGSGEHSTLELGIILAASLAVRELNEHRRVGLVLAGPKLTRIEPSANPAQRWLILRALAQAEAGRVSLAELLAFQRPSSTASSLLITASTNPAWVAAARQPRGTGSLLALLLDVADFEAASDQHAVVSALANHRIPFTPIPGRLLDEAYSSTGAARLARWEQRGTRQGERPGGGASWQKMG